MKIISNHLKHLAYSLETLPAPVKAFKGFSEDMNCRNFHYDFGKSYHISDPIICHRGFHACLNPLDLFFYRGFKDRFASVTLSGKIIAEYEDADVEYYQDKSELEMQVMDHTSMSDTTHLVNKVCASDITINKELTIDELISTGISYTKEHPDVKHIVDGAYCDSESILIDTGRYYLEQVLRAGNLIFVNTSSNPVFNDGVFTTIISTGGNGRVVNNGEFTYIYMSKRGNITNQASHCKIYVKNNYCCLTNTGNECKLYIQGSNHVIYDMGGNNTITIDGVNNTIIANDSTKIVGAKNNRIINDIIRPSQKFKNDNL
jgi:hypothetical protein